MKVLAIAEPDCSGHHMVYVRRIVAEATRRSIRVVLFTGRQSLQHPAYLAMSEEAGDRLQTRIIDPSPFAKRAMSSNLVMRQFGHWLTMRQCTRVIRAMSESERPEFVLVPYLDSCDKAMSLLGSPFGTLPWGGLPMHMKFHFAEMGVMRQSRRVDDVMRWLYGRLLNVPHLRAMFTIDELLCSYTKKHYPSFAPKVHYLADPVDLNGNVSKSEARRKLGVPDDDKKIILVYGAIALRKGLPTVVEAAKSDSWPSNVRVLLAGPQDAESRELLKTFEETATNPDRIFQINRFLIGDDEYSVFKSSDMVWIGYIDFYGMSDVMIQAAKLGLPTIASKSGLVGWMTQNSGAGIVINEKSVPEALDAVNRLAQDSELYASMSGRAQELASHHSVKQFTSALMDAVTGDIPTAASTT